MAFIFVRKLFHRRGFNVQLEKSTVSLSRKNGVLSSCNLRAVEDYTTTQIKLKWLIARWSAGRTRAREIMHDACRMHHMHHMGHFRVISHTILNFCKITFCTDEASSLAQLATTFVAKRIVRDSIRVGQLYHQVNMDMLSRGIGEVDDGQSSQRFDDSSRKGESFAGFSLARAA